MATSLVSFSDDLATAVERAAQAVVAVHGRQRFDSSGVHWAQDLIVTADHALRRDEEIRITTAGGTPLDATLVGRDPGTDLAVLRVPELKIPVVTKKAQAPRVGSIALAVSRSKEGPI